MPTSEVAAEAEMERYTCFQPGLLLAIAAKSPAERVLLGAQMAREDLESGFTTVRNVGHSGIDGDTALRDAINADRVREFWPPAVNLRRWVAILTASTRQCPRQS